MTCPNGKRTKDKSKSSSSVGEGENTALDASQGQTNTAAEPTSMSDEVNRYPIDSSSAGRLAREPSNAKQDVETSFQE
jgi:hypothetical protein